MEGRLTQEDTDTIPECFHMMLKYLQRKKTTSGDLITTEHYSGAGLLEPIGSQKWVQFWARARAGKRGGVIAACNSDQGCGEEGVHRGRARWEEQEGRVAFSIRKPDQSFIFARGVNEYVW